MNADDPDVIDSREIRHDLGEPSRRQHQGIAAGQDHFPDFWMRADVVERVAIRAFRKRRRLAGADHLAAKTKPAIHRTDMDQLEQHSIGIAMHDPADRRMRMIANRIGVLARSSHQFLSAWNELPRDRIVGIIRIDQRGHLGRHRHRIARRDLFQIGKIGHSCKPIGSQLGRLPQRRRNRETHLVHVSPEGFVHTT
jgi:hypothetical protein